MATELKLLRTITTSFLDFFYTVAEALNEFDLEKD